MCLQNCDSYRETSQSCLSLETEEERLVSMSKIRGSKEETGQICPRYAKEMD